MVTPARETATGGQLGGLRYVDLTLGAWRPREAARQLAAVTGTVLAELPTGAAPPLDDDLRAIDRTAAGDPFIIAAHDDAVRIAAALKATPAVVLLPPRHRRGMGVLDDWFFLFLRRHLVPLLVVEDARAGISRSAFEIRRGVDGPPAARPIASFPPQQQGILRFFPGLLPRAIAERYRIDPDAAGLTVAGVGHFLIPPAYRDTDPSGAATALDAMADLEELDDGFKALAQSFCTAHFAESAALATLARSALRSGDPDLASELAIRARAVARTPEAMAEADLVRQEIRLAAGRYPEIVAAPPPSRQASEAIRRDLGRLRLRAAVAGGSEGEALRHVEAAAARLGEGAATTEDFRLLILRIRAAIGAGRGAEMRALAEAVDAALADTEADPRLAFLSGLNLAALAGRSGDRSAARAAIRRAFSTSAGGWSLAESIAMNALLAQAEDDPASDQARLAWLRAALAWLAFEPAEALPPLAVEAVAGEGTIPPARIEAVVGEALGNALERATPGLAARAGIQPAGIEIRSAQATGARPDSVVGGPGAAVLWSGELGKGYLPYPLRDRLVSLASAMLREIAPVLHDLGEGTMFVDLNAGLDIPRTRGEALSVALRAGVGRVVWGGETILLDAVNRPRAAADLRISLSPLVAEAAGPDEAVGIRFRRFLEPVALTGLEAELLGPVRQRGRVPLGTIAVLCGRPLAETEAMLRSLEARRIIRLDVEERPASVAESPLPGGFRDAE